MTDDPKYQPGEPPVPGQVSPDVIISPDTRRRERIPPGQSRTRKWPVLHAGTVPSIDIDRWQLTIHGAVQTPLTFHWHQFQSLPRVEVFADFHCVTRWSRLGNLWSGVSVRWLLEQAKPDSSARFAVITGADAGWTTNLSVEDLLAEDALLADHHDGVPLDADHGGPVRLIVPQLYAWKSAKWVSSLELTTDNRAGYWEREGYHLRGDPWVVNAAHPDGERFRDDAAWTSGIPPGFSS